MNVILLIIALTGLFIFSFNMKHNQKLYAFFGTVILLVPLIYITIGLQFIAAAPVIGTIIVLLFPGTEKTEAQS